MTAVEEREDAGIALAVSLHDVLPWPDQERGKDRPSSGCCGNILHHASLKWAAYSNTQGHAVFDDFIAERSGVHRRGRKCYVHQIRLIIVGKVWRIR